MPDAPNFVMGDFNHCKMVKSLSGLYQYVTCFTHYKKCLDLCYGSVKGVYTSFCRAPLGMSDHNVVYLVPLYISVLKKTKCRLVPVWSEESINSLQDCFSCTNWEVFFLREPDKPYTPFLPASPTGMMFLQAEEVG